LISRTAFIFDERRARMVNRMFSNGSKSPLREALGAHNADSSRISRLANCRRSDRDRGLGSRVNPVLKGICVELKA